MILVFSVEFWRQRANQCSFFPPTSFRWKLFVFGLPSPRWMVSWGSCILFTWVSSQECLDAKPGQGAPIIRRALTEVRGISIVIKRNILFCLWFNLNLLPKVTWCNQSCGQSSRRPRDRGYSLRSDVQAGCPLEVCGFHSKRLNCVAVSNSSL